jgi:hypothetical protein
MVANLQSKQNPPDMVCCLDDCVARNVHAILESDLLDVDKMDARQALSRPLLLRRHLDCVAIAENRLVLVVLIEKEKRSGVIFT